MASLKDFRTEIEMYVLQWAFLKSGMDHDRIAIWLSAGVIALLVSNSDVLLAAHVDRLIFGVTLFLAIICVQVGLATVAIDGRLAGAILTNDGTTTKWNRVLGCIETAIKISFYSWSTLLSVGLFVKFFWGLL